MSGSSGGSGRGPRSDAAPQVRALLAAADEIVANAHVRERFGELGPAFASAFRSRIEPFAAAMRELKPTAHSQAAARAMADVARLTGTFAGRVAHRLAAVDTDRAGPGPGEHYAALSARIDDAYREFSATPEFDRARRAAAAAVFDWLEHDPGAVPVIVRTLEPAPLPAPSECSGPAAGDAVAMPFDGHATLVRYRAPGAVRGRALVVPGFTTGAHVFDLDPGHSAVRTLAGHGVETWLLDWGGADETDRLRTVADQIERIDRAVEHVRAAGDGPRPALAGHFHGGLLALLYCIRHPGKTGALVTISTPVEFRSRHDVFAHWLRAIDGERLAGVFGNIPGAAIAALHAAASPMESCGGFFNLLGGVDSAAAAIRIARFDQARRFPPAFPGETFGGLYRSFYRDNAFVARGGALLDGFRYDCSSLTTPVLNVFARDDRIVPPEASAPLAKLVRAAPCTNRARSGGHYDLLAEHRTHTELLPDVAAWLTEHARRK